MANSSVGGNLKTLDSTINSIREIQSNGLLNTIIGVENENAEPIVESDIYFQVASFISNALRMVVLLMSLILLSFAVYSRFAFAGSIDAARLQKELDEVKKEIAELKKSSKSKK